MKIKITFAVFQNGAFSEYVDGVYSFDGIDDGVRAMAELVNNNQFAAMPAAREHAMSSNGLFQPPSTSQGLGSGTLLLVHDVEVL